MAKSRGRKLPPKVERCVRDVKAKGKSKIGAIKICQKTLSGMA